MRYVNKMVESVAWGFGCPFVVMGMNTFEFLPHVLARVNNHPIHAQHLNKKVKFWTNEKTKLAEKFSNKHCLGSFLQFLILVCLSCSGKCLCPKAKHCFVIGMRIWCWLKLFSGCMDGNLDEHYANCVAKPFFGISIVWFEKELGCFTNRSADQSYAIGPIGINKLSINFLWLSSNWRDFLCMFASRLRWHCGCAGGRSHNWVHRCSQCCWRFQKPKNMSGSVAHFLEGM